MHAVPETHGPMQSSERRPVRPLPSGVPLAVAAVAAVTLSACGPSHHLAEYDFRQTRVAAVAIPAPPPEIYSNLDLRIDRDDPLGTALRVGTGVAREVTLDGFRNRVDSAALTVDVPSRIADRTLDGALRYLRAVPVVAGPEADFELEFRMETYGFTRGNSSSGAVLALEGDLLFLDGRTGRIVWSTHVTATNPIQSTSVRTSHRALGNVATAVILSEMSVAEIEAELEVLADISADALVRALGRALDEARES